MTVNDDEFARLFQYIEDFRAEVKSELGQKAKQKDAERIITLLDGVAGRLDNHETEIAALVDTSRRHEDSIENLVKKLQMKLGAAKA